MSVAIAFRFESSPRGGWVPALGDSALVTGPIATQDAGSTNRGIYYQVGGGGMNGIFADALDGTDQRGAVNARLRRGYDDYYGTGAWQADAGTTPPRSDRLTSFVVEITPDGNVVGDRVVAVVYSVGPQLDHRGLIDDAGYQRIYFDAIEGIDSWNDGDPDPIVAMRVTMLSCGIYGDLVDDKDALYQGAAHNIIVGIARGLATYPQAAGFTVLINTNDSAHPPERDGSPHVPRERPAFTAAATGLGLAVDAAGFTADPDALVAAVDAPS